MTNKISGLPSLSENVNVKDDGPEEKRQQSQSGDVYQKIQPQPQKEWESNETFFICFNNEKKMGFEIDLISQREKGKEERFLKFELQGLDRNKEGSLSRVFLLIDKKENFEAFKEFISKLNWNS